MTLNNTYIIQNKPLKELLDSVDDFIINMSKFKSKHSGYSYNIEIKKYNDLWEAEIIIKHEKQEDIKTLEGVVEPPTLL